MNDHEQTPPTMTELWALLQEQRAMMEEQKAEIAELRNRLSVDRVSTDEASTPEVQRASSGSASSNGKHPAPAPPAPGHKGWRLRRDRIAPSNASRQLLLPKPDDGTPVGVERRLSRLGLLKAAAVGVAGMAAIEAEAPQEATPAAASTPAPPLTFRNFSASGGAGTAYATATTAYDIGLDVTGNSYGAIGVTKGGALSAGVLGQALQDAAVGVWGQSRKVSNGQIVGLGNGTAVQGQTYGGIGVRGVASGGKQITPIQFVGGIGVQGESSLGGIGVHGWDDHSTGTGVMGRSFADSSHTSLGNGVGVWGQSGTSAGVQGTSASGIGVEGRGDGLIGVRGTTSSNFFGVYGRNFGNQGTGVTGRVYTDDSETTLGAGVGVLGESGSSFGVWGTTIGAVGVLGSAYSDGTHTSLGLGTGVWGQSGGSSGSIGVKGSSTGYGTGVQGEGGTGVRGVSSLSESTGVYGVHTANDGIGVAGRSYADSNESTLGAGFGVWGDSGSGIGVKGSASTGRGGVFSGGAAQLQLVPSSQQSPPTSGQTGDLFLDSTAKLWLCTAGGANAVWVTMGSGGGGGSNGGPIVAHSGVIATPGVYGDNNTNDPTSIGISGASVDGNGQPGAGIGVKGASGTGAGVLGTSSGPNGFGVHGIATGTNGQGVLGEGPNGVVGRTNLSGYAAVYGEGTNNGYGLYGVGNGTGSTGVFGTGATGVYGQSTTQYGVYGLSTADSLSGWGVYGANISNSARAAGVTGLSLDPSGHNFGASSGVYAGSGSGYGIYAESKSGIGVRGLGGSGRGGVFSGGSAQLQMVPAAGAVPVSGQDGDLFLDSAKQLWLCTAGGNPATWQQLGAGGGGGGNGGPLTGHSTVIATPGVYGYNDTNDANSIGVSGASVDAGGNPGNGTGVKGTSGYGDGVRGEAGYGFGVSGYSKYSIGVEGSADGSSAPAIQGRNSTDGTGVKGISATLGIGVDGESSSGIGVNGFSTDGRGAVFGGGSAQLRLLVGGQTHPTTGLKGDLYLDSSCTLWICTADNDSTAWKQVQVV